MVCPTRLSVFSNSLVGNVNAKISSKDSALITNLIFSLLQDMSGGGVICTDCNATLLLSQAANVFLYKSSFDLASPY